MSRSYVATRRTSLRHWRQGLTDPYRASTSSTDQQIRNISRKDHLQVRNTLPPSSHQYPSLCKSSVPVVATEQNQAARSSAGAANPTDAQPMLISVGWPLWWPFYLYLRSATSALSSREVPQTRRHCGRARHLRRLSLLQAFLENTIPWNPQVVGVFCSLRRWVSASCFFLCSSSEYSWYLWSRPLISCST